MKSIEIYRRKINNRKKGSDSGDTCDTAIDEQPVTDIQTYIARCYVLWGKYHRDKWKSEIDRRVYYEDRAQEMFVLLKGVDKADALSNLDTRAYEFIEWWG